MPSTSHDLRLFGLDLRELWRDLCRPWQNMHRWPWLAWLTPAVPVRLLQVDGRETIWLGDKQQVSAPTAKMRASHFVALELPEDRVLQRSLSMPAMSDAQILDAVSLEARTISPFVQQDLLFGYSVSPGGQGLVQIQLVLASRTQVEQYVETQAQRLKDIAQPEVWVMAPTRAAIVVMGFGEKLRAQYVVARRRMGYAMLVLALFLLGAIAITPTMQLYLRARDAGIAHEALHQRTKALLQQREALVKTVEQLAVVEEVMSNRVDPLWATDLITKVLPDNTYLQSLQIQGQKVTLSGQTTNAAELMQHLSTQEGVRDVKAPSAATRPLGATKESFTVEFVLDPKALSSALAAAPTQPPTAQDGGVDAKAVTPADAASAIAPPAPVASAPKVAVSGAAPLVAPARAASQPSATKPAL